MRHYLGRSALFVVSLVLLCLVFPARAVTWSVSNMSQLNTAMGSLANGDEVVLAPGTYDLRSGHTYYINSNNVTFRGSTGNFNDVILYGGGMNNTSAVNECLGVAGDGITVKDITISGFFHHAIHYQPGADNSVVQNVHTLNNGEQHIKGATTNNGGVIANCLLEQTEAWQKLGDRPTDYVGGIDLHTAINFDIHDNVALNIKGNTGGGDPAYFLWNHSTGCTVQRNIAIGCSKGIALGNPGGESQGINAENCIVRNNFIVPNYDNDIGMEFCFTKNCEVLNNTVYRIAGASDPDFNRTIQLWDSATLKTVNLQLTNNLVYGNVKYAATGTYTLTNNIIGTAPLASWFVNPAAGDLHLTAAATAAINHGIVLADVPADFDGVARSSSPDIGADERPLHPGDANKDGRVDVVDLGALALNYEAASGATWVKGDYDGNGAVDVVDLGILARNYDWVSVGGQVPEPGSAALIALAGLALLRRSRRK